MTFPALVFDGKTIKGSVLRCPTEAPELQAWRTAFAGVRGESEIIGKTGGRTLLFEMLLFGDFTKREDLFSYIESTINGAAGLIGRHGTVQYKSTTGTRWSLPWRECTCEGFTRMGSEVPDVAGTLDGGWFVQGVLKFRQTLVE